MRIINFKMSKVSIIVPVYNVEKYIERCAVSLFEQDFEDIEYIFVNDCTPDNSVEILQKVIEKYPNRKSNVKIFHHEKNRGLGAVRRTGLEKAIGDYILHIDSDDWVELNMISSLYNKAKETDADIVACDFVKHFKGNKKTTVRSNYTTTKEKNFEKLLLGKEKEISPNIWNKLVKRDLYIKNSIYPPIQINFSEDWWLMIRLFVVAKNISYVPKPLYHYNRANDAAITRNLREKHWTEFRWHIITTQKFLEKKGVFQDYKNYFYKGILNTVLRETKNNKYDYKDRIKQMCPHADRLKYVWQMPRYSFKQKLVNSFYVLDIVFLLRFWEKIKKKKKRQKFIKRARWVLQKFLHFVRPIRYEKTAWILGVGRSATTWVSSLINYQNRYNEWFEPFQRRNVKLVNLGYQNYTPLNSKCIKYAQRILSGEEYYQSWMKKSRKQPLFPSKDLLIVKDITMHLQAYELCYNNPRIKPILLIRNPFAVVLSQQSLKWDWDFGKEFEHILTNPNCLYLYDLQNVIKGEVIQGIIKNRTDFEEKILIWSILNYVPLKQFTENKIEVTFYEDWVMNADKEMERVYKYLELPDKYSIIESEKYKKPSRAMFWNKKPEYLKHKRFSIDAWKEQINEKDYQAGMRIYQLQM